MEYFEVLRKVKKTITSKFKIEKKMTNEKRTECNWLNKFELRSQFEKNIAINWKIVL